VEDHPLEYATFEGVIPAGEYGAGTVEIWDKGTYELIEEKKNGGLTVRLHGERLEGEWALIPARLDGDPKNWLLLRHDAGDGAAAARYSPMLATATDTLPTGEGWLYEPKWDGFRAIVTVSGGDVRFTSRNGNDLTERFRNVARAATLAIRSSDAVLDGEICALDDRGRSRFSLLQESAGTPVLVLFDLLELESEPLLDEPLSERRKRLEALVVGDGGVVVSPQFDDGPALLAAAREQELEGVVAKREDSPYRPGRRSVDWHKLKLRQTQEVVIAGYTRGQGRRAAFGALVVGVHDAGELRWAGNVGTGFSDNEIERLRRLLEPLERSDCPFAEAPKMPRVRKSDITWVDPVLVAEVEFAEWTHEGRLRAPSYLRLREDKAAPEVRRERDPVPTTLRRGRRELRLSNLDKPFWPEEGITKGDLIAYYRDVAEVLVPHLRGRPFTMKRYPDGWQGKSFFQKNAPSHMPEWIDRAPLPASTREGERKIIEYALVNDELALLWMANMGCIDLHTWASRVDRPERPEWVMFDLDPSEGSGFEEVIEVAGLVKRTLDLLELESYPKTSGSRGIHILVPIARRHTFEEVRDFAAIVAGALARAHPGLVTTEWARKKRKGVLVDANQNRQGATNASVYSVRPRAGAPVSAPLRWEEVALGLDPFAFTMDAVLDRVARDGDLHAPVLAGKQSLKSALKALR
jgi:bifunctional non-homologous end joining protein LigD